MKKAAHMYPLVEAYLSSGVSQQHFSQDNNIDSSTFHYWLKKYRTESTASASFMEVDVQPFRQERFLELTYPNGVKVSVSGSDLSLISQLLRLY
jgi:transposase-like protein